MDLQHIQYRELGKGLQVWGEGSVCLESRFFNIGRVRK